MFSSKPYIDLDDLMEWNITLNLGMKHKQVKKDELFLKEG